MPTCDTRLEDQAIQQTKEFWERKTGVHLDDEDARESIENIVSFFSILAEWEQVEDAEDEIGESEMVACRN